MTLMTCAPASVAEVSDPLPIKSGSLAFAVSFQRTFLADGIGADENPVLPGGQASEYTGFHGFVDPETQVGFHTRQGIGRQTRPFFDGQTHFVVPIDVVGGRGDQT